jgi:hypothetical protein
LASHDKLCIQHWPPRRSVVIHGLLGPPVNPASFFSTETTTYDLLKIKAAYSRAEEEESCRRSLRAEAIPDVRLRGGRAKAEKTAQQLLEEGFTNGTKGLLCMARQASKQGQKKKCLPATYVHYAYAVFSRKPLEELSRPKS